VGASKKIWPIRGFFDSAGQGRWNEGDSMRGQCGYFNVDDPLKYLGDLSDQLEAFRGTGSGQS
jgi:hypothetical protein